MKHFILLALLVPAITPIAPAQGIMPPTPTGLTAEVVHDMMFTGVKLTWTAPSYGLWGFRVYRSVAEVAGFTMIGMTGMPWFLDHNANPGEVYFYYVTSVTIGPGVTPIEGLPSDTVRVVIDPSIPPVHGVVEGAIKDDTTGAHIRGVCVSFHRITSYDSWTPGWIPFVYTDSAGHYKVTLDTGTYKIYAEPARWMPSAPPPYLPEWYDDAPDKDHATLVSVGEGQTFIADFGLSRFSPPVRPKGIVRGAVTDDTTNAPIVGVKILFFNAVSPWDCVPSVKTDEFGRYEAMLDTGTYLIKAEPFWNPMMMNPLAPYRSEWYDDAADPASATPVTVTAASEFVADFGLSRSAVTLATVEGTVRDTLGNPIPRATVALLRPPGEVSLIGTATDMLPPFGTEAMIVDDFGYSRGVWWKGQTDSLGHFEAYVPTGMAFIVVAHKWGFVSEYYDNKTSPLTADVIKVDGNISGVDFSLSPLPASANSVSGIVRDSSGGGIPAAVILFPARPFMFPMSVRVGHTDTTGAYSIGRLPAGGYRVLAIPYQDYAPAFYKKETYGAICWKDADIVMVSGDVGGIDIGVVPIHHVGLTHISGTVTGSAGTPLEGVRVVALGQGLVYGYAVTDLSGHYALEGIPAMAVTIIADVDGYQAASRDMTIPANTFMIGNINFTLSLSVTSTRPGDTGGVPSEYRLQQNYPNPFNPSTVIRFELARPALVHLAVYNLLGQEVKVLAATSMTAGVHTVWWDGTDGAGRIVAGGLYFYKLEAEGESGKTEFSQVRKMLLLK